MEDILTLYTTVKPHLYRNALFKSTFSGVLGALILVCATLFLPVQELEFWGPLLGLIALFIIGFGFRPFLKLKKLDSKPIALRLGRDHIYWKNISIVTKNISNIRYDDSENYGIEITSKAGQKLFLPYYSKRTYEEVSDYLNDSLNTE